MKYIVFLAAIVIVWLLIQEVIVAAGTPGKSASLRDKWRNLGGRIHIAVGLLAALIIVVYVMGVLFHAVASR